MADSSRVVLHQSFLPPQSGARALVWKYTPVNWGRRPRHFHAEPEMNLVVRGSAVFGIGRAVVHAASGDLLSFPPGQDHVLIEASPDLYLYAFGLDPSYSSQVLAAEQESVALPFRMRLSMSDFEALSARAARIVDRTGVDLPGAELWDHAHWLRRKYSVREGQAMHVLTRRALSTISASPDLGLTALAKQLRASPSEVSRYFHRDVGIKLVQYRARLRLLHFISLVDKGNDNLLASAERSGFGSYSQCHRTFQSELGCGPRDFLAHGLRQRMQAAYDP
jgi:AraC-like DNA-binding protein/quercetin dioxygenase-like cupin family protein